MRLFTTVIKPALLRVKYKREDEGRKSLQTHGHPPSIATIFLSLSCSNNHETQTGPAHLGGHVGLGKGQKKRPAAGEPLVQPLHTRSVCKRSLHWHQRSRPGDLSLAVGVRLPEQQQHCGQLCSRYLNTQSTQFKFNIDIFALLPVRK